MKFLLSKLLVLVQMVWAAQAGCKATDLCKNNLGSCMKDSKTCDGTVDTQAGVCKKTTGCKCCLPACPVRCTGTCPSGYTEVDSQCLSFNTGSSLSWSAAHTACTKAGGRLAKAKDADKLATYLDANYAGQHFWLGASDADTEGTWLWLAGGYVDSSKWYSGEPNNAGSGEDCMLWWGADDTGYIDEDCTESRPYICEADKETT